VIGRCHSGQARISETPLRAAPLWMNTMRTFEVLTRSKWIWLYSPPTGCEGLFFGDFTAIQALALPSQTSAK
jgi:hypothetical protein